MEVRMKVKGADGRKEKGLWYNNLHPPDPTPKTHDPGPQTLDPGPKTQKDRNTDRRTDRQTERRQTERQTDLGIAGRRARTVESRSARGIGANAMQQIVQTDAYAASSHHAISVEVSTKGRSPYQRAGRRKVAGAVADVSDTTVRGERRKNKNPCRG